MLKAFEQQALYFLRGEENPFDAFVVPDKPAHAFAACHVEAVHQTQFEQICRVIDKYRTPDYRGQQQLHDSRVLVVRGVRGSGKTHLLHILRGRDTVAPEVWVCPRHYDPGFPFAEYLLSELVRALLTSEDADAPARLRWIARELTRRLCCEAVCALNCPEWLVWARPSRSRAMMPRRAARRWADREALLEALARERTVRLPELCDRYGLPPDAAWALILRHVERTELGTGIAVRMRREVILAFAELTMRDNPTRLAALLEQDFAQPDAAFPPVRADWVTQMLQTLVETLAAVGVPVIIALDNMERLLAPRGPVDNAAAQAFFHGLAHTVDQTRGVLLMLFVERGLWNEFSGSISSFAEQRLRQGVRIRDYGCVWDLELPPPTPEQVEQVVRRRMTPLLARAPHGDQLAACFPFTVQEVRQIATEGVDVLRTALLRLRDRYDERVLPNGQLDQRALATTASPAPATDDSPLPPTADAWERSWDEAVANGRRRFGMSRRVSFNQELHAGLGRWLRAMIGHEVRGWRLSDVRSAVTFGDHPIFGSVTLTVWHSGQHGTVRVALGPVLGEGRSMPKDLEVKLSVLDQRPQLAEQLVVLWPVAQSRIGVEQLPPATREIWNVAATSRPVSLCCLTVTDLAWLLEFPAWFGERVAVRLSRPSEAAEAAETPDDALTSFLLERTGYLLADVAPVDVPRHDALSTAAGTAAGERIAFPASSSPRASAEPAETARASASSADADL